LTRGARGGDPVLGNGQATIVAEGVRVVEELAGPRVDREAAMTQVATIEADLQGS
jgi:hypothetical protein